MSSNMNPMQLMQMLKSGNPHHEEMIADLIASYGEEILYNTQEYFDKINWGFL